MRRTPNSGKRPSSATLLPGRPRLIVTRTMSKAFAFAGARVGYFAADPAVVEAVQRVRLPYHLSAITQAAARGALAHSTELLSAVDDLKVQRDRIVDACKEMGLRVADSDANFVLFGGFADQAADGSDCWTPEFWSATLVCQAGCASPPELKRDVHISFGPIGNCFGTGRCDRSDQRRTGVHMSRTARIERTTKATFLSNSTWTELAKLMCRPASRSTTTC